MFHTPVSRHAIFSRRYSQVTIRRVEKTLQLLVPLTTKQMCSFSLRNQTIRQLIQEIRVEDPSREKVVLLDSDKIRLSHSTPITYLLQAPFYVQLDSEEHFVTPPEEECQKIGNVEVEELTLTVYFQHLREKLLSQKRDFILYSEFKSWCDEFGIPEQRARELLGALHTVGEVLYFPNNEKLRDYIFIKTNPVLNTVVQTLDIKLMKRNTNKLIHQLSSISKEYTALNENKLLYDDIARRSAKRTMRLLFAYICIQFGVLGHMVWYDFNWDIMEPISYFVGLGTTIGAYWYFILFKQDYTYDVLEAREMLKKLRKLYIRNEFDWPRWNTLNNEVNFVVREVGEINLPDELKYLATPTKKLSSNLE